MYCCNGYHAALCQILTCLLYTPLQEEYRGTISHNTVRLKMEIIRIYCFFRHCKMKRKLSPDFYIFANLLSVVFTENIAHLVLLSKQISLLFIKK